VVGPRESGELVQLLTPIIWNQNTAADIMQMTWYHPTYAEILHSLARDICNQSGTDCPEV
jgi:pyruvate/2-oxoglutarate dehydrogenase complex dihydrolipoamide dehydrogenase (E3) component